MNPDAILDPRASADALSYDASSLGALTDAQRDALAKHPNAPLATLDALAAHYPEARAALARNPAIALLTFQGAPSDALLAALGEHPPADDPSALQQQLTLSGAEPYYQLGLRLALVEPAGALPDAARVAIEARLELEAALG
jgi:hypothetical protein